MSPIKKPQAYARGFLSHSSMYVYEFCKNRSYRVMLGSLVVINSKAMPLLVFIYTAPMYAIFYFLWFLFVIELHAKKLFILTADFLGSAYNLAERSIITTLTIIHVFAFLSMYFIVFCCCCFHIVVLARGRGKQIISDIYHGLQVATERTTCGSERRFSAAHIRNAYVLSAIAAERSNVLY